MLVKNWMTKTVITVDVKDSMQDAINSLKEYAIPMLPVMKKGNLVGIVTDRDLKSASPSNTTTLEVHELLFLISEIKVRNIMTKDPITVPSDFTVEEAAELFFKERHIRGARGGSGRSNRWNHHQERPVQGFDFIDRYREKRYPICLPD